MTSRSMRQRLGRGLGAALVAAVGLTACGGSDSDVIRIGTLSGQPHLYHPHLYEQFAPEGVEIEVVLFDTSPDIKNAVVSDSIDFGVTGVPAALAGIAQGEDVKVIASAADGGSGFVADPSIASLEDLVGAQVGYPSGSSQEVLLRLTLADAGVDIDELELVNLPFSDMAGALESNQIDAFLSAEMGPSIAQQAGAQVLASPYETPVGRVNIGLITRGSMIEDDPDLVQQVVDMHAAAVDQMNDDTQAWVDGVVETYGLDADIVELAVENIWPRSDLSPEYIDQVEALIGQMVDLTQITSAPDVDDVFDTTFVENL